MESANLGSRVVRALETPGGDKILCAKGRQVGGTRTEQVGDTRIEEMGGTRTEQLWQLPVALRPRGWAQPCALWERQ